MKTNNYDRELEISISIASPMVSSIKMGVGIVSDIIVLEYKYVINVIIL